MKKPNETWEMLNSTDYFVETARQFCAAFAADRSIRRDNIVGFAVDLTRKFIDRIQNEVENKCLIEGGE
ncbi:hypothetical protein FACS1894163_02410 [Spirochaetia bacterium]|nr:hypothetical protein FACS1894163_02410 [Spirochaetia bacterium]